MALPGRSQSLLVRLFSGEIKSTGLAPGGVGEVGGCVRTATRHAACRPVAGGFVVGVGGGAVAAYPLSTSAGRLVVSKLLAAGTSRNLGCILYVFLS